MYQSMYRDYFHLTHLPFQEEANPEVFFPGGRREEVCQSLILDILAGKKLVKLVGREGSGKTMLCQMVADRLPSEYQVITPAHPLGSFDDLAWAMCLELGMDPRGKHTVDHLDMLPRLLQKRAAEQIKIVLIIDEAEKLYLATLERLLLCIGECPEEVEWTTLLVGRPSLDTNLDQMSVLCRTIDIHAGYFLEELTASETRQYLHFRLKAAGMQREQQQEVFDEEAVDQIIATARGNLRKINILAEQVLQAACNHQPAMAHPDPPEAEPEEEEYAVYFEDKIYELWDLLRSNRWLTGVVAGTVLVVLVAGLLLSTHEKGGDVTPPTHENQDSISVQAPRVANESASSPSTVIPSSQAASGTLAVPPAVAEQRDGDKLFRERLAASANWLTGLQKGKYTIQLIMLVSNQGQATIAETLAQDEYYQIRDQLYVFRKKTNPPTIFVYHGLYDSLDAAREARNNMPVFLRKQHPYPLAVNDALKKLGN
jgi:type II secretory pathway predicted ATPase ExeA